MLSEIIKRVHNLSVDQQKEVLSLLKSFSGSEERGCARKKINLNIDGIAGEKVIQANTEDISASGVYVNVAGRFRPGENVKIVFQIPSQNMPFKINGELVRVESSGIAIQFKNLSPYFKKTLDEAIWA